MRSFLSLIGVMVLLAGLTACGKYHGHYGEHYFTASDRATETLSVPHGMASPVKAQLYPVPNVHTTAPTNVSLVPPDPQLRHALALKKAAENKKG